MNKFNGVAMVKIQSGATVLLWSDMWNNKVRSLHSAEGTHSFQLTRHTRHYLGIYQLIQFLPGYGAINVNGSI
jgi:hypothetical protein